MNNRCPVITDNEIAIDNLSELFCLEDNLDLTQISNLLNVQSQEK